MAKVKNMARTIDSVVCEGYSWLCEKGRAETLPYNSTLTYLN